MKELLLNDWSFFRVLRVVIGIIIMIDGLQTGLWLAVFIGGFFLYQGLFNVSCGACVGGNCNISEKNALGEE